MTAEEWRTIDSAPDYQVSNLGQVRSLRRGQMRVLKPWSSNRGYLKVSLYGSDGTRVARLVHQLVLEVFIGSRPEWATDVRHLNDNRIDNRLENLRYGTRSENVLDRVRNGVHHLSRRDRCANGHEFTESNTYLPPHGSGRVCRTCSRHSRAKYKQKVAA